MIHSGPVLNAKTPTNVQRIMVFTMPTVFSKQTQGRVMNLFRPPDKVVESFAADVQMEPNVTLLIVFHEIYA